MSTLEIDRSRDVSQPLEKLGPDETLKANSDQLRGTIAAGLDKDFTGEAWVAQGATVGYLQQEPPPQAEQKQEEAPPQQPSPTAPASTGNSGSTNVDGVAEQQKAQTLAAEKMEETERLRVYLRMLTKKVQDNLLYPDAGRKDGLRGTASVAFTVQADGTIAPGTLRVATSSGQPRLDAAAMKTVEASAPFAAPPRVISIAISVVYGKLASGAKKK